MAKIDLTKYGITGTTEIVYNPSYEMLFEEETKPGLEGFEKGRRSWKQLRLIILMRARCFPRQMMFTILTSVSLKCHLYAEPKI